MVIFLALFLIIDVLIAYYLFRQAFVVRSNMNRKYKKRFAIMVAAIGGSALATKFSLPLAILIALIPAGAAILFALFMGLSIYLHKGPWR